MSGEEDIAHINDNFDDVYDASEYTPISENIELQELPSSSNDSFHIENVADILVRVSREAPKRLAQGLLKFFIPHRSIQMSAKQNSRPCPSVKTFAKKAILMASIILHL